MPLSTEYGIVTRTHPGGGVNHEPGFIGHYASLSRAGYGVLPCDGRPFDIGAYRELAAAIGDTYGTKDGQPCLPDMRGKPYQWGVPIGAAMRNHERGP